MNTAGAEAVAKEIEALGRKASVAIADVSKLSEVEQMIQKAVTDLGPLNTMYVSTKAPNINSSKANIVSASPTLALLK